MITEWNALNTMDAKHFIDTSNLFDSSYIDSNTFYMYRFGQPPSILWMSQMDHERLAKFITKRFSDLIVDTYHQGEYNLRKKKASFQNRIIVLSDQRVIELVNGYCAILYPTGEHEAAMLLMREISVFKKKAKAKSQEINIISKDNSDLTFRTVQIKKTKLDLSLYYEDDFKEVDALIQQRLGKKKEKGIVLLHGLPGTGKTTYLRYLISRLKKKVLILSAAVTENLMDPEFMDMLMENPDSIIIIEDAEHVIMDRKSRQGSSVSNLLNISDGLMADFLNIQVICTFNSSLASIDSALLRKGRLIARYEFGKLSIGKAQRLSQHLGFDQMVREPMTIAEITNQHEKTDSGTKVEVIGFKRQLVEN